MGKVFNFRDEEFKRAVKVGWRVKAAPDHQPACAELENGNIAEITDVSSVRIRIENCSHGFLEDGYIEVVSGYQKDFDSLGYGDILINGSGSEHKVLDVLPHIVFIGEVDNDASTNWFSIAELKANGWKIKGAERETTELTLKEIADKFQVPVDQLRVKDN